MTIENLQTRIDKLEILFSEQEYTVESLNTVVTRQAQEIDKLSDTVDLLKHQIQEFKKQIPESAIVDEKPPHY
ncbi:MAG: SlyX family protein [Gammaproteobacteria bacterium]|nr:SlyX family protein [Gammaproteobacteria bacterium]